MSTAEHATEAANRPPPGLAETAMTIILHAGDARLAVRRAYECLANGDRAAADAELETARARILAAHKAQTDVIQDEARGAEHRITVLFSHAQDTLMTIKSEVVTAGNILGVVDALDRRLSAVEDRLGGAREQ
jgi:PTS system cellobiose-specific IIA component